MTDFSPVTCSYCHAAYDRDEATGFLTHSEPPCAAELLAKQVADLRV